jgi:hypothetical protein
LAIFSALVTGAECIQMDFPQISVSNLKCQSTAKLLVSRKYTTLVIGDLKVFKENFVERGKVLTGSRVQGVF